MFIIITLIFLAIIAAFAIFVTVTVVNDEKRSYEQPSGLKKLISKVYPNLLEIYKTYTEVLRILKEQGVDINILNIGFGDSLTPSEKEELILELEKDNVDIKSLIDSVKKGDSNSTKDALTAINKIIEGINSVMKNTASQSNELDSFKEKFDKVIRLADDVVDIYTNKGNDLLSDNIASSIFEIKKTREDGEDTFLSKRLNEDDFKFKIYAPGYSAVNSLTVSLYVDPSISDQAFNIDWGDGSAKEFFSGTVDTSPSHKYEYEVPGSYYITVSGNQAFGLSMNPNTTPIAPYITNVFSWGGNAFTFTYNGKGAFGGTGQLKDLPLNGSYPRFEKEIATRFLMDSSFVNSNLSSWNVSTVKDTSYMFANSNFSGSGIKDWVVSSVTNMSAMFSGARYFNGDVSRWNVSKVTNMSSMFNSAGVFNQDLSNWDVSSVTDMSYMFNTARTFNQDLSNWGSKVSKVTDMMNMFHWAKSFNGDLSSWNVSKVTNMMDMFARAFSFKGSGVKDWNVSSVTNMNGMFYGATSFNQDLFRWDVSNVTDMNWMFHYATSFNQDISGWDVSSVTNMNSMFHNATSFNQDISGWDVSNVTDMNSMFAGVTLSPLHYDAILIAWSTLPVQQGVFFIGGNSKYTSAAQAARETLTTSKGWRIRDGNQVVIDDFIFEIETSGTTTTSVEMYVDPNISGQDFSIDWGDGTADPFPGTVSYPLPSHTYTSEGTYKVTISGSKAHGLSMNPSSNPIAPYITKVLSWGGEVFTFSFQDGKGAFEGTTKLIELPEDSSYPRFEGGDASRFFAGTGLVSSPNLNSWNVTSVTNMNGMFAGATSFTGIGLNKWEITSVTDMVNMFDNVVLITPVYDDILKSWGGLTSLQSGVNFSVGNYTKYSPDAQASRDTLTASKRWNITDGGKSFQFRLEINITKFNELSLYVDPNISGQDFTIFWGDGTWETFKDEVKTFPSHIYKINKLYTLIIDGGQARGLSMNPISNPIAPFITKVLSWGGDAFTFSYQGGKGAFEGTTALSELPEDESYPKFETGNAISFFRNTKLVDSPNLSNWKMSNVVVTNQMFFGAISFDGDLSEWDVSKVREMTNMFFNANSFTGKGLNNWITNELINMNHTFARATKFNADISGWNVSSVTDMGRLFYDVTLPTSTYDAILIAWAVLPVKSEVKFYAGNSKYSAAAQTARETLTNTKGWIITDGGL